jgi:hypothetical protein
MPWSKAVARRAARTTIGQELKAIFQVPQDLPRKMVVLLRELAATHEQQ